MLKRMMPLRALFCLFALAAVFSFGLAARPALAASKTFRVTFSVSGAKPIPAAAVEPGGTVNKPADPVRPGYRFTGWYVSSKKTVQYDFSESVSGPVRLFAGWEKFPQISFTLSGGKTAEGKSTIKPVTVGFDEQLPALPVVSKSGYRFDGWYADRKSNVKFDESQPINGAVRLYARWTKLPQVVFSGSGGAAIPKQSLNFGELAVRPPDPKKTGYEFQGWYTDPAKTKAYDFELPVEGNLRLFALWAPAPSLTFVAAGGSGIPAKQALASNDKPRRPETDPVRIGYTFGGWYTSTKYKELFDFSKPVEGKVKVYAQWIRNPVISFSTKGKVSTPSKQVLKIGGQVTLPSVANPPGYSLEGWYTDSACKKRFDPNQKIEASLTLYANWVRG